MRIKPPKGKNRQNFPCRLFGDFGICSRATKMKVQNAKAHLIYDSNFEEFLSQFSKTFMTSLLFGIELVAPNPLVERAAAAFAKRAH